MYSTLQYQNAENTIILAERGDGTSIVIEEGDAQWNDAVAGHLGAAVQAFPLPSLEEVQSLRLAELEERRKVSESGGTTLAGNPVSTDDKTRAVMTAAYVRAVGDPTYTITNFKSAPGAFGSLTNAEIIATALQIETHIQACFDNEQVLSAAILAATNVAGVAAVDIESGWPAPQ